MKILKLQAENFLRLRAVEITPTGEIVKVSGANGEGKSSTLDSIWAALDHRRIAATEPVRRGAKKAIIKLDLGEVQVERTITGKSTSLTVTDPSGKVASPQKFLDALIGELSFDPLAFDRMKPKEQAEALRKAIRTDFDFEGHEKGRQKAYDDRTDASRRAKEKRAQAEAVKYAAGLPKEKIDTKAILDKMEGAARENAALEQRKVKRQSVQQHAEANEAQVARHLKHIEELEKEIEEEHRRLAECQREACTARERLAAAPPLPEPVDVSATRAELEAAESTNRMIDERDRHEELEAAATQLEQLAEQLSIAIEESDKAKSVAIAAAGLPVEGLDLTENGVIYHGFPYEQSSNAERIRVSMAIAMAANPTIRVIRITDGSLLDSKSMAIIAEMAKENDFQVWMEICSETGKVGIVIEDGMVAAVNP